MGSIISGMYQTVTAGDESDADKRAANQTYDREWKQANAAIQSVQEKGAYETGRLRIRNAQLAGQQKLAYTASGVDATKGTAADVQANTAALGEHDAQMASINAAREVWGIGEAKKQAFQDQQTKLSAADRKYQGALLGGVSKYVGGIASLYGGG